MIRPRSTAATGSHPVDGTPVPTSAAADPARATDRQSGGGLSSPPMQEFLSAIQPAPRATSSPPSHPRDLPGLVRPPGRGRHVRGHRVRGQGPAQVAPRGRRRRPRARPRRGLHRRDGQRHQLQHGVDLDLRAAAHLRVPRPAGQGERLGRAPRPRLPRGRVRRLGRGAADRLGRAQLEARRQGHRPLQLRRRPEPECPRRLDAGRQPAHLGLRDQLRRPGRPGRGQGQPADAQADPPDLGGGGGQRPVQLDLLPDAGVEERRPHAARATRCWSGAPRAASAPTPCSTC